MWEFDPSARVQAPLTRLVRLPQACPWSHAFATVILLMLSIGEYGLIAMVNDTEGNLIGLHSMN